MACSPLFSKPALVRASKPDLSAARHSLALQNVAANERPPAGLAMRVNDLVFGHRLEPAPSTVLSCFQLLFGSRIAPRRCPASHSLCSRTSTIDCLARLDVFFNRLSESLVWVSESWATSSRPAVKSVRASAKTACVTWTDLLMNLLSISIIDCSFDAEAEAERRAGDMTDETAIAVAYRLQLNNFANTGLNMTDNLGSCGGQRRRCDAQQPLVEWI